MKWFSELLKFGIVIFVLICGLAGFALSYHVEQRFFVSVLFEFLAGIGLLSAGSFALNQVQEQSMDAQMPRTKNRPLPSGKISSKAALSVALLFILIGSFLLYEIRPLTALLGLFTVVLYNGFYTLYWKKHWIFGAVPGAIPGAMPVVMGYSVNNPHIFSHECVYAFMIMFLWQMPHYWSLAIRFSADYKKGSVPTLPVSLGSERTLFHMGLYMFAYVGLAILSPWFVDARYFYIFLVVPICFKVAWEFFKYFRVRGESGWLSFFMWTNVSMLIFLAAPVIDKWLLVMKAL